MTPASEAEVADPLRHELQTRYPRIGDEIQGAIDTLRKLQQITDTLALERPAPPGNGTPATMATVDIADKPDANYPQDAAPQVERPAPALAASESFGRYQIVRLLGRGAMGAVYLAYDSQLERYVALKTPTLSDKALVIQRFYREARATAQLRSPHICPIYDVGQIAGIHYLSMAFIDGLPLSKAIARGQVKDASRIVDLTKKIARGLQKAHEHGIVHRDLKPDNIMIDADGEPIVMDFGLAKRLNDEIRMTAAGNILGTPAYMSPEQVEGDPAAIGPATDIYSLGVVLYEMLTGKLPYQGSMTSVLCQIVRDTPPRPSAIAPGIEPDAPLERICLRLMAKVPAERFPSMADAAEALEQLCPRQAAPVVKKSIWNRLKSFLAGSSSRRTPSSEPAKEAKTNAPASFPPTMNPSDAPAPPNEKVSLPTIDLSK